MKWIACIVALGVLTCSAAAQLAVGRPSSGSGAFATSGSLTIIPILTTEKANVGKYITLAEATAKGLVEIVEIPGNQQVNALQVRNKSDLPLMLVAGELLIGGKQDRIVAKDFIIQPHSRAEVPVFCVEHGRWTPGVDRFKGGDTFVPEQVRQAALQGGQGLSIGSGTSMNQQGVWDEVASVNKSAGTAPETGTVRGTLDDPKVRAKIDALTDELDRSVENSSRTVGMMVWLNGKILTADVFANHALFDASRMKLLRSYAVDAYLAKDAKAVPVDIAACRKFLEAIVKSKREMGSKTDFGNLYQVQGGDISGYESGSGSFGGGAGGAGRAGFGHGNYRPGKGQ